MFIKKYDTPKFSPRQREEMGTPRFETHFFKSCRASTNIRDGAPQAEILQMSPISGRSILQGISGSEVAQGWGYIYYRTLVGDPSIKLEDGESGRSRSAGSF